MKLDLKIDWTDFVVLIDAQGSFDYINFEVSPENFLSFATEDLKNKDIKGRINCLTNCKRAIDCQIDWIISYLGIDYLELNEKKYPFLPEYLKEINGSIFSSDMPFKIKFIQIMGIAPMLLISNIRKIRNELEHEYKIPTFEECQEALELTDLFINSTQNKMWYKKKTNIFIKNRKNNLSYSSIGVSEEVFNSNNPFIEIFYYINKERISFKFYPSDKEYLELLYISVNQDYKRFPRLFDCPIEEKYINYEIDWA